MGERETGVPDTWGTLLTKLLDHEIVTLLSEADASMLSKASATLVLYDHLRSFMALKSSLKSSGPHPDALRPLHEALLNFAARLFMATHQALLNNLQKDDVPRSAPNIRAEGQHRAVMPTKRFLLEWQLVRLKAARERLIMEFADLSQRNTPLFEGLSLPDAVSAEVESARLRVSNVWKELPAVPHESPWLGKAGGFINASVSGSRQNPA
ncbi:MAG: hypothetical protein JW753_10275 [Dehalococcoidia bacterium]|nr:hypothetical protein [Dehalococcoidia bacterium]